MNIQKIKTDNKGLVELINFIHSEDNICHIEADTPSNHQVYSLSSLNSRISHGRGTQIIGYEIDVTQIMEPNDKKYQNKLLTLLDKISE